MKTQTLLIEIGTEELPARLLNNISLNFYKNFITELNILNIKYKKISYFSTPRRLALKIQDINMQEQYIEIQKRGPSIIKSYDKNGYLTESAISWLKHYKINIKDTIRLKNKKGEWLLYKTKKKQDKIESLIPKITELALKKISSMIPMRWEVDHIKFFRPIRNIVMLLDDQIVSGKIFNINSNRILHNHIAYKEQKIIINHAKEYPNILFDKQNILANYIIRKEVIIKEIKETIKKIHGYIEKNHILIDEITSLVESPIVLLANFKKKFLKIPRKILKYVIEKQQKCLPIYNDKNDILPYFIFVSNINSNKSKIIISDTEKVMHARLSDIEFFLKNDRKTKLENHLISLKNVLFQNNIGSMYEKTLRLQHLIRWITQYYPNNLEDATRAAMLSKCDLITNVVCEFPELQGTIGMYYALENQEKKTVALAIEEQYLPAFSGDILPKTYIGSILSISDKIDTLSGMFYIGNIPSSNKDPFALRRLALGILRIIIKQNISLDLKELINNSLSLYNKKYIDDSKLSDQIIKFFISRLFYWYQEIGYSKNIIQSVLSYKLTQPIDINKRIKAVSIFQKSTNSESIMLCIKRIINILEKEKQTLSTKINTQLMEKKEEIILFNQINNLYIATKQLFLKQKYEDIFLKIKDLEKPIYHFFDNVKIYHSNPKICLNRLILLNSFKKIIFKIADFSYLY
ncbi:glycine--tRNA ligase subunit beta [Buchnera aphidicola]|uniref:Glycine--tRNA ligase beta subunit n=1 Tax=Buchnera aphidicola str. Ua (Uroleucon ambrosiae) TaxID=1005057 RepID=G2LP11_BUCUM|nr:glycine--tRNA ligase subunit beta [Buchnera aphidicola]AEO07948.1 glycyl-tRNA synthetase beta chain [Buchnera aphidicola str. Ua (Uroleucon ambrosiae)]